MTDFNKKKDVPKYSKVVGNHHLQRFSREYKQIGVSEAKGKRRKSEYLGKGPSADL